MVRVKGVEPPRLAAPDPKSGASANSATPALKQCRLEDLNPQPTDYKSVALPIELSRHEYRFKKFVYYSHIVSVIPTSVSYYK
jgi:hypothetical protein